MKPRKQQIEKWVIALRSGKYKQTQRVLQNHNGFCCLGVACNIFAPNYRKDRYGDLIGELPQECFGAPKWLREVSCLLHPKLESLDTLQNLNDDGHSFDEIADILEAVFIHEVLD